MNDDNILSLPAGERLTTGDNLCVSAATGKLMRCRHETHRIAVAKRDYAPEEMVTVITVMLDLYDPLLDDTVASFTFVLETRNARGQVLRREEGGHVTVTSGYQCDHGVWTKEEAEDRREEQGVANITDATCGWCASVLAEYPDVVQYETKDRLNPKLRPCRYFVCLNCEERIPIERARDHLWSDC